MINEINLVKCCYLCDKKLKNNTYYYSKRSFFEKIVDKIIEKLADIFDEKSNGYHCSSYDALGYCGHTCNVEKVMNLYLINFAVYIPEEKFYDSKYLVRMIQDDHRICIHLIYENNKKYTYLYNNDEASIKEIKFYLNLLKNKQFDKLKKLMMLK